MTLNIRSVMIYDDTGLQRVNLLKTKHNNTLSLIYGAVVTVLEASNVP